MKNVIQRANERMIPSIFLNISAGLVMLSLVGCAVGPDFKTPKSPVDSGTYSYTATPLDMQTEPSEGKAGVSQKLVMGQDIPAQWWEIFHSEELDALIRSALEKSPDLASAQAALRQAQENYNAQSGNSLYPSVTASFVPERDKAAQGLTTGSQGNLYTLKTANVSVDYTVDVFGGIRRELEGLRALVDYQRFQVEAAYLTLTTNLVTTAITEASLRAQIAAQQDILSFQSKQLEVVERRFSAGAIAKADVLNQRTLVAQTRAALPALEKTLQQTRNQLAVYAGRLPGEADLPEFDLDSLQLPEDLPVSIPSELVRQRPDIRANEALLHQASALVGVATANQYPKITLTAAYGSQALTAGSLFSSSLFTAATEYWRIAGGLTQPLFNGGALSAQRRAAVAFYDKADAQYRANVLTAFQNVADSLLALELDAKTLKQQVDVVAAASQTLSMANAQFDLGAINSLVLLDAKRTYQQERINLVKAQAARYTDTAALFQSLGGGWWNRPELTDISVKSE